MPAMGALLVPVLGLAILVGLSLGLLGGGGSILTVPLLTYVAGMPAREAIAASLFVVGVTSLVSLIPHARLRNIRWSTGLIFGGGSMIGAFGGGLLGARLPATLLMILFATMMVLTAGAMLRGRPARAATAAGTGQLKLTGALLEGMVVGAFTGLVGAGGGFLVVPALVLLGGLPMPAAVGTSLLVIAMKSFAGLGGYLTSVSLDWPLVLAVTGVAVLGSLIGSRLISRVPEQALRRGFGYFVLAMGVFVLQQELPTPLGEPLLLGVALLAVLLLLFRLVRTCRSHCPRRPPARTR